MDNSYSVQRTVPRFSILAIAKLANSANTIVIVGKMSQISRKGCYVSTPSTLAIDTPLNVVISHEGETFTTAGKVIYVHEGAGMGIVFINTGAEPLKILDRWLASAARTEAV